MPDVPGVSRLRAALAGVVPLRAQPAALVPSAPRVPFHDLLRGTNEQCKRGVVLPTGEPRRSDGSQHAARHAGPALRRASPCAMYATGSSPPTNRPCLCIRALVSLGFSGSPGTSDGAHPCMPAGDPERHQLGIDCGAAGTTAKRTCSQHEPDCHPQPHQSARMGSFAKVGRPSVSTFQWWEACWRCLGQGLTNNGMQAFYGCQ